MEAFKLKEHIQNSLAIQREYFSDLIEKPNSNNLTDNNTSTVVIGGKKYEKTYVSIKGVENVLYIPKDNIKYLPVIELSSGKDFIKLQVYKVVKGNFIEHEHYTLLIEEDSKEIKAQLKMQYFDISDEAQDKDCIINYFLEKSIHGRTSKKLAREKIIDATRDFDKTSYTITVDGSILSSQTESNNDVSLFELLKSLSKQMEEKNKTK